MKTFYFILFLFVVNFFCFVNTVLSQSIRKNYTEMTQAEKDAFVNALYQLRTGADLINDLASFHNANFGAIHNNLPQNDVFLAWHRRQIYELELALQEINEDLSIPYWDETINNTVNDALWNDTFLGQFNNAWGLGRNLGSSVLPTNANVSTVQNLSNFYLSTSNLGSNDYVPRVEAGIVHTGAHNWVNGIMASGNSPLDPVFYLHHSFVDKLWQEWEEIHGTSSFIRTNMPRYDGNYTFNGINLPSVNPNSIVDSRSLGVFYAENQMVKLDDYEVKNLYRSLEKFYYQYTIEAGGDFVVPNGKSCFFESTTEVVLKPGFSAVAGSNFTAKIDIDKNLNTNAKNSEVIVKVNKPFKNVHGKPVLENAYSLVQNSKVNSEGTFSVINYPNPFTKSTIIEFNLLRDNIPVNLVILNMFGEKVVTLLDDEIKNSGLHRIVFDNHSLTSGTYYYSLQIGDSLINKRMILIGK